MNGDVEEISGQTVSISDAEKVNQEPPKPTQLAKNEKEQFDHAENMEKSRLGWIGRFWGNKSEKPGNISAIVAIVLAGYLGAWIFFFNDQANFSDVFAGLSSIITLILGYLFGSSDRR